MVRRLKQKGMSRGDAPGRPSVQQSSQSDFFALGNIVLLLLLFWLTRLLALDSFPPFLDESVHIHFGEVSLRTSPLAFAAEGRLFTIWWYLLFQPVQGASLWTARAAIVLVVLSGFAAAAGVGRIFAGWRGAVLAGLLLLFSSFHFFFERLALADTLSASAVIIALYFAARLSRRVDWRDALLCGVALFIAIGFKVSALPYLGIPIAAALTLRPPGRLRRDQAIWLALALAVGVGLTGLFALALRFFDYDLFFLIGFHNRDAASGLAARLLQNAIAVFQTLMVYAGLPLMLALIAAVALLMLRRRWFLPLCLFGPLLVLLASERQTARFYLVPAAILLLCGAAGLASLPGCRRRTAFRFAVLAALLWGLFQWLPFAWTAARDPENLGLAPSDYAEYISGDASGFGLDEVGAFLEARQPRLVLGLLSNCQSLRYRALSVFPVECPRINPNGSDIEALAALMLEKRGAGVYVVLEDSPYVPRSAPGKLLVTIARPGGGPALAIHNLAR